MIYPFALLALVGAALAADEATTTVDILPLLGFDPSINALSVMSARPEATTYSIGCAPSAVDTQYCDLGISATLVQGPDTFEVGIASAIHHSVVDVEKANANCQLNKPRDNEAICTKHLQGAYSKAAIAQSATLTIPDYKSLVTPMLVTGGVEKLSQSSGQAVVSTPRAVLLCGLSALVAAVAI